MENNKMMKLKNILSEEDFQRALISVDIFKKYSPPWENNDAINSLWAFAMENEFLETVLNQLSISGLPSEALEILFREYFKQFTLKLGYSFTRRTITKDEKEIINELKKLAQSTFPNKDENTIACWLYNRIQWFLETSNTEEAQRTIFLLSHDTDKFRFGGLRSINLNKETSEKLLPLAKVIGRLMSTMYDDMHHINNVMQKTAMQEAFEKAGAFDNDFMSSLPAENEVPEELTSEPTRPPKKGTEEQNTLGTANLSELESSIKSFLALIHKAYPDVNVEIHVNVK